MDGETKLCTNCKRDISTSNFVMHEMHCRRHIVLCDVCDEPIPRTELEQHFNDMHQKVPCDLCKTEIAKDKMEDHLENKCPKKQMRCEYCELSFPKDGVEAHIDYCGSRTECCNLCQQYVMLKDMTQHELSGCTYPEPKPTASSNQTSAVDAPTDPFSMSYLNEFLDFGQVNNHIPSNSHRQQERQRRDRPSRGGNNTSQTSSMQNARGRQSTRNKSNVNSDRERASDNAFLGSSVDLPPDMDYDTMLALQLAHEDLVNQDGNVNVDGHGRNEDNSLNYHWEHFSDNESNIERQTQTDSHADDNEMTIPCDACHLEIPADMYIEHSEYCWQGIDTNNIIGSSSSSEARDRNNAMPVSSDNLRPSIPVIDNLHQPNNSHSVYTQGTAFDNEDDFSLPCEFCEEIYPSELILQHQVVCPQNMTATPRVTTPASGLRTSRRRDKDKDTNQAQAGLVNNDFSSAYSTRFGQFGGDSGRTVNNDNVDENEDGPRSNYFRDESYKTSLQSASDKYGGMTTINRASYFASHRSSRRNSNTRDTEEEEEGPPRTYEPARTNRSAQRARAQLSQLLRDNDDNSHHGNARSHHSNAGSHHSNNHHRRGAAASSHSNNTAGASSYNRNRRGRGVDARTVIREVNRETTRASQNGLTSPPMRSRTNNNSSATTPTTNTISSTTSRNRQRSDHVFSPELRPKPNDNRRR